MSDLRHAPIVVQPAKEMGAATLVVVLVLFFAMSMVVAYTNRNILFEQRTASNQYRSTRALEAADAGVDWALALLNTGRIGPTCATSTSTSDTDFRQRYLVIDGATGNLTPKKRSDGVTDLYPTCAYNGTGWSCSCPSDTDPSVAAPSGTGIVPAFRVRFRRVCAVSTAPDSACTTPSQPAIVHIDVNGCTSLSEDCLAFPGKPVAGEGRATVHVIASLVPGVAASPVAALTARSSITATGTIGAINSQAAGTGITMLAGGAISAPGARLIGPAGTPASATLYDNDATLAALSGDRFFQNVFAMSRSTYRDQPGAIVIDCSGGCNAATVRNKVDLNPGRPLWLNGDVNLDSVGDIGSAGQPVVLNVTGNLQFSSTLKVFGLVYSHAQSTSSLGTWTASGAGSIVGAAVSEAAFGGGAITDIVWDRDVLTRLRTVTGSFVKVPGTWKDFDS